MKRSFSNILRIVSLVIVVVITLSLFAGCKKSENNSELPINGTWVHSTPDGKKYYYTFSGGTSGGVELSYGASIYTGGYEISDNQIVIYIDKGEVYQGNFVGRYGVSVSDDGNNLKLSDVENEVTTLTKASKPEPQDYIKPDNSFVENKELTGKWKCSYANQGDLTLVFNSDGTMLLDMFGVEKNYGVYLVTDTAVTISFYQDVRTDFTENYTITDGNLNILGTTFTK